MIRIIIVEDHDILREGLRSLLGDEPAIRIVADAPNGKVLLDYLETTPADVILMGINMPVMNGVEATRIVSEEYSHIKVLVLSMLDHPSYVEQAMQAGAKGYLLKNSGKEELVHAIREVAAGNQYISKRISEAHASADSPVPKISPQVKLTKREMQILELLAEGFTNREIAEKIFLSKRTVESHRKKLLEKTNCKNSSALIKYAIYKGILKDNKVV
ncbi:MAG: DNA-binding response regulator [Bacteroidetes bacterium]|nr:DNA-binding response regulator [Bacteroidota bacterium]